MNARDFNFPPLPDYTATWYALRFEPMRGTGEQFTCAILLQDKNGTSVRKVVRDDVLKALFGDYADHVQNMIDMTVGSLAENPNPIEQWRAPVTGFSLSAARTGTSRDGRDGVFRQAVKLSAAFAQLDYGPQEVDEAPALEAARTFISRIKQQVVDTRYDLAPFFQKSVCIVPNGTPVQFGFLMPRRAAHFEILRPNTISTSVKFARAKLYELKKARVAAPLERAVLIVGVPNREDLAFSDRQHAAIARELAELQQEAREDETDAIPAESAQEAAAQVIELAT